MTPVTRPPPLGVGQPAGRDVQIIWRRRSQQLYDLPIDAIRGTAAGLWADDQMHWSPQERRMLDARHHRLPGTGAKLQTTQLVAARVKPQ